MGFLVKWKFLRIEGFSFELFSCFFERVSGGIS